MSFSKIPEARRPEEISLNNPHRAGDLPANTPHFMVLLISIPVIENIAFTCGRAKMIRIRYVWTRIFLKTEKKISVFKKIWIRVDRA